jgi:hypothetical protein
LGGMGAAVMIGNSAIAVGRKLSYEVSKKGVIAIAAEAKQTMASMFEQSKQVLAKAEMFIESVKEKLAGTTMSQELNGTSVNQQPTQVESALNDKPSDNKPNISFEEDSSSNMESIDFSTDFGSSSDANQSIQEQNAEKSLINSLGSVFGIRGIKINNAEMRFNGESVFKLKDLNSSLELNGSSAMKAAEIYQQAISDYSNVKGTVIITLGSETIFKVVNGEMSAGWGFVKDKESLKADVILPEKMRYDELAAPLRATGYEKTKQITSAAISAGDSVESVKDMLSKYDTSYQGIEKSNPALNEQMMVQAQARAAKEPSEGKTQERTVERAQDMAIVA